MSADDIVSTFEAAERQTALALFRSFVEKMTPKVPKGDYNSVPHYRCPQCFGSVKVFEDDPVYPHCHWCGQTLDWR